MAFLLSFKHFYIIFYTEDHDAIKKKEVNSRTKYWLHKNNDQFTLEAAPRGIEEGSRVAG